MITINETEAKNRFDTYLQKSKNQPVVIERNNQPSAILISHEEYERLVAYEDAHWAKKADEAEKEGYLTEEESLAALQLSRDK